MTIEELYLYADEHGIDIDWIIFKHCESLSAPIKNGFVLAIDPTKLHSSIDEKMKLSHEIGHCETFSFYSPHDDYYTRQRYENRADKWAIKKLVPAEELIRAFEIGYTNIWELADYFSVSEDFMKKVICLYNYGNIATWQSIGA